MPDEIRPPTQEELAQLPHRAIVAFTARCARRVQPLYRLPKANPEEERRQHTCALDVAIDFTERFSQGTADSAAARKAADAAASAAYAANAVAEVVHAAQTARAAAYAAWVATSPAARDAAYAATGDPARHAAGSNDYKWLRLWWNEHADEENPTVPEEFFHRPLWPGGEPDWWDEYTADMRRLLGTKPDEDMPDGDSELELEIDIPEGVTIEELKQQVGRLALLADESHRALGGHGLKIESMEVYEEAPVQEEVPYG